MTLIVFSTHCAIWAFTDGLSDWAFRGGIGWKWSLPEGRQRQLWELILLQVISTSAQESPRFFGSVIASPFLHSDWLFNSLRSRTK